MKKVDFNEYSENYDDIMQNQHSKFGDISYYSEYKVNILKSITDDSKDFNIMEYGCGIGRNLPYLTKSFEKSNIYAFDISSQSLEIAEKQNPAVKIVQENDFKKYKNKLDIIFIAGVYHHISPKLRDDVTQKVFNLLKNNGLVIIFEHNPYNPLTRYMVNTCEFDKDAILLSKTDMINLFLKNHFSLKTSNYTLFVPPKLKFLNFIEKFIGWVPFGGQYYTVFEKNV